MCSAHSGVCTQLMLPGSAHEAQLSFSTLASEALKNLRTPFGTTHLNASDSKQQPRGGGMQ